MGHVEVTFQPHNKTVCVPKGTTLLEAARKAFIDIESSCNGKGTCGKCRVQLSEGAIDTPYDDEKEHVSDDELASGVRLACRSKVIGQATFKVLGESKRKHRILSEGFMPEFELDPNITKVFLELPKPALEDNVDDLKRIERALGHKMQEGLSLSILQKLPAILKASEYKVTLVMSGDRLIGVEPGDTSDRCFGVAVDIGTTTVVTSLIDLTTGDEIATSSMINPQKSYGLDVLTRIHYIREHEDGLETLSRLIREGIDILIGDICGEAGIERKNIYEVTVAANATMMHLFLAVDATSLGSSPYVSVFTSALSLPAGEVGIEIAGFGSVYCLPSVSSYIGADIVAGMIAAEMDKSDEKSLLIDIGTNGEIVFGSKDGLYGCSCAAGPALEGMNISCGMRAADGAIEKIYIDEDVSVHTIGDKPAIGICGSGIIDAVAELAKVGIIGESGRFIKLSADSAEEEPAKWRAHLKSDNGKSRFVLSGNGNGNGNGGSGHEGNGEVAISQKDIRQVQLAKGAILSGILALTSQLDIGLSDIDRVYVAGAFGHHVRMESLARLGVFPPECIDKVTLIGNSSKTGAVLCLLSKAKRIEASQISKQVKYLELSCYPDYDRLFADCLSFPKVDI